MRLGRSLEGVRTYRCCWKVAEVFLSGIKYSKIESRLYLGLRSVNRLAFCCP